MTDHGFDPAAVIGEDGTEISWRRPVTRALHRLHAAVRGEDRGEVAGYIPELARADPAHFGIALASVTGAVYHAGDALVPFTIQSVSKPFVYALALQDLGLEQVLARVGVEPTGEAFNDVRLEPGTGRPLNPMVNAGAILTTSLVAAETTSQRHERIRAALSAFAGRELVRHESTYESELATGDRNRALAYLMHNAGALTADVTETLDCYVAQCSLLVTTVDLAVMAATLANGGVNPVTGVRAVDEESAGHVLTVMATCGMYTYAGEWLLRAGLPAKSGVAGGLLAASPAQFGVGAYSPRLDAQGNSVRAVLAVQRLSSQLGLDLMRHPGLTAPVVTHDAMAAGGSVAVIGLQGDLDFAAIEAALGVLAAVGGPDRPGVRALALDLSAVTRLHPVAKAALGVVLSGLRSEDIQVVVADDRGRGLLGSGVRETPSLAEAISAGATLRGSEPLAAKPQRVADHRDGREGHRRRSDDR
ncbi:MAG: glutaminase A [Actinomycetota bacterium]|nr:MAG: glutaminase A [Actinomycetota bacterium]